MVTAFFAFATVAFFTTLAAHVAESVSEVRSRD